MQFISADPLRNSRQMVRFQGPEFVCTGSDSSMAAPTGDGRSAPSSCQSLDDWQLTPQLRAYARWMALVGQGHLRTTRRRGKLATVATISRTEKGEQKLVLEQGSGCSNTRS